MSSADRNDAAIAAIVALDDPAVNPAAALDAFESFVRRFAVLPDEHAVTAVVLWVAHTHALAGSHATPYLLILSPEKRSGKTRVQEVLELLVARPWRVTSASEAAMFRKIAQDKPTLLLDEIDAIFGSHSERTEPLRAVINAGNRPGASVARCVGEKGERVKDFNVYCTKALAGIDKGERIPDTIRDRSIPIAMRRKTPAEPVERFRHRKASPDATRIREALTEWADNAVHALLTAEPDTPHELDDRAAEAWEPLLAIADLAGGEWRSRARRAAVALNSDAEIEEQTLGSLLLAACREAFAEEDRITTTALLEAVNGDEELPFGGWRDGQGLDGRRLSKLLRPYRIKPRSIRLDDGSTPKGYLREQFTDAWERWLPHTLTGPPQAPHPPQAHEQATPAPLGQAGVADVADVAAESGCAPAPLASEAEQAEIDRISDKFGVAA